MILVDTSIWIDHLRSNNKLLASLLGSESVLIHPFVIGELALGNLRQRKTILTALSDVPRVGMAADTEVLHFIDRYELFGRGIGYVDAHLLAVVRFTPGTYLWTSDNKLHEVADELDLAMKPNRRT
jgi:predicted nucleic acid-binding protein